MSSAPVLVDDNQHVVGAVVDNLVRERSAGVGLVLLPLPLLLLLLHETTKSVMVVVAGAPSRSDVVVGVVGVVGARRS